MLSDETYKEKTILELAFESGFNSKTTFNRVFKEKIGMTPQDFRKKMVSKNI